MRISKRTQMSPRTTIIAAFLLALALAIGVWMIASATARRTPENEVVRLQASLAAADATGQSARLEKDRAEEAAEKTKEEKERALATAEKAEEEKERAEEAAEKAKEEKERAEEAAEKAKEEKDRAEEAAEKTKEEKDRALATAESARLAKDAAEATAEKAEEEKESAEEALQKYEAANPYMVLPTAEPSGPIYIVEKHEELHGLTGYDDLLLRIDAIVKAQLISHRELVQQEPYPNPSYGYQYRPWLEFKFEVFEYLRGSGPDEIIVRVPECAGWECWYRDLQSAMTRAKRQSAFLSESDEAIWDERESLLLLIDSGRGYYTFGSRGKYTGWSEYSIISEERSTWLPLDDSSASSRSPRSAAEIRYLTDAPSFIDKMTVSVPGEAESLPALPPSSTISLEEMQALITETDAIISRGKEYVQCESRRKQHIADVREGFYDGERSVYSHPVRLDSGQPAGHIVESGGYSGRLGGYDRVFITGRDQDLFVAEIDDPDNDEATGYHIRVKSTRPLPAGEYKIFFDLQPYTWIICDFYPMERHQNLEWIVSVVSPEGVLHEAFFDPAQGGSDSVGFSEGSFGILEPATIQSESDTVEIESLTFSDGVVEMTLSDLPEDLSYFYSLEFMDLEGVEALVLDFNSYDFKGIENGSHFVRWCVKDVPWSSSSKIMLRIRHVSTSMNLPSEEDQCKP